MMFVLSTIQCDQNERPTLWIRFNPNGFTVDGTKVTVPKKNKYKRFLAILNEDTIPNGTEILYIHTQWSTGHLSRRDVRPECQEPTTPANGLLKYTEFTFSTVFIHSQRHELYSFTKTLKIFIHKYTLTNTLTKTYCINTNKYILYIRIHKDMLYINSQRHIIYTFTKTYYICSLLLSRVYLPYTIIFRVETECVSKIENITNV